MSPRAAPRTALMGLAGLVLGCGTPSVPPGFTPAQAAAFQEAHAREVSAEVGPLTVVASHYIDPGQTLVLGVVDGALTTVPAGSGPRLRLQVEGDATRCLEGCGPTPKTLDGPREAILERFRLQVSPQSGATRVLVHDPKAPARAAYDGLHWFPVDARFIVAARFEPDAERPTVELSTSRGLAKPFVRAGVLRAELLGQPIALVGYEGVGQGAGPGEERSLLVPFADHTTGDTTYPVGRYLQVPLPESGPPVLDFNRATNPWCAYSEHYNCPIPPTENRLALAVEAGEQTYAAH